MSHMSERARQLDSYTADSDWMPVVAHAIERLDLLATVMPGNDVLEIATLLRSLFGPPKCRECGRPLDVQRAYYGQGAVFCTMKCREDCLSR